MTLTIGVDVGGTKIAAGVVDAEGRILNRTRKDTPSGAASDTVGVIADLVRDLADGQEVRGVGVAIAGFVSADRSTVLFAPNLGWQNEPLRAQLERHLALPVIVENDANAAAWGEFRFGASVDVQSMLMITLGTGIGGGIVVEDRLLRGAFGVAAEVGHIRVVPNGLPCPCGNRGCWEQYGSGTALLRAARSVATSEAGASLLDRAGGTLSGLSGPLITAAARAGDPCALSLAHELADWIGEGLALLTAVLDPDVIVIGGGVAEMGDLLLDPVGRRFRGALTGGRHRPLASIRPAMLGNLAGLVGAADLAR